VLVLLLYPVLVGPLSSVVGLIAPAPESTHFNWNGAEFANQYRMYFGLYYCMTGLHALHVILGMGILYWVYLLAQHNRFSSEYYTPMEVGGLYWHLVDLIWIYLFPLLYLID
ncbi:MAG: cytochrome c oxidase subunit 3, partial [Bdellovibrionales bacterium]|nr:cytochrome c oxidase subunit 3 [Bdellovibrionales bacterium]